MQKWIGTLEQGTIAGLFDTDKTSSITVDQQQSLELAEGDLVTVTDAAPEVITPPGASAQTPVSAATDIIQFELLAPVGSSAATVYRVLAEKNLDPHHSVRCEQEAREWQQHPGHDAPELHDLTALPFVTIDNADSRDLDQALYIDKPIEADTDAPLHIYYALADASYYVRPGTAIFREAIRRAVTYYVPGLSIPMLPRALSEDLVSLNPHVVRRALLFNITVDNNGEATETTVSRVLIKSQAKLAYHKVQELYDCVRHNNTHPYLKTTYGKSLLRLQELGQRRIKHAQRRDVVDYNRSETRVTLSNKTLPATTLPTAGQTGFKIDLRQRSDCERYNEQVSLLCNMEGARLLEQLQRSQNNNRSVVHSIFRVHSPPLEQRLTELRHTLGQLCDAHDLDNNWRWQPRQPLSEYLSSLPETITTARRSYSHNYSHYSHNANSHSDKHDNSQPHDGKAHISATNAEAIRRAIERLILLTNRASFFSDEPGPHHALGVQSYARFSSPMREIAGIFTHKELLEALALERAHQSQLDEQLQDTIVEAANASKRLQKELDNEFQLLAIESYLHRDLLLPLPQRPVRQATIMGMRSGKVYVNIDGFGTDIKVYLDDLARQFNTRYKVTGVIAAPMLQPSAGADASIAPEFRIGDRISLRLLRHDPGNRRFVLAPEL